MKWSVFVAKVASFEGYRDKPYLCPSGVWTIGYGRTSNVNKDTVSAGMEAEKQWLDDRLKEDYDYIRRCYPTFNFNDNQLMALSSFTFNCGRGNLKKLIEGRTIEEIAEKILLYNHGAGRVLAGLTVRRKWECDLFLTPLEPRENVVAFYINDKWCAFTGDIENDCVKLRVIIIDDDNELVISPNEVIVPEKELYSGVKTRFFSVLA